MTVIKVVFRDHSESNIVRLCEGVFGMVDDYFEQCSDKDVDFRTNWFQDSLGICITLIVPGKLKSVH